LDLNKVREIHTIEAAQALLWEEVKSPQPATQKDYSLWTIDIFKIISL
jgi:hypothetical protein